jgi:hypothetical protein
MNPFKFLALSGAGYLALVIVFGSGGEAAPSPTVRVPQTVQIVPLTQEQEADRKQAILQEIANLPVETTTTLPQLAQIDPDTKCQEWLPLAVEMGWPNETHILQRLGQVMWKESRCQPHLCSKSDSDRQCHDYGLTQINWTAHNEWWARPRHHTWTKCLTLPQIFTGHGCCTRVARKLGSVAGHLGRCHAESPRLAT